MADNIRLNPGSGGDLLAAFDDAGVKHQRIQPTIGGTEVSISSPLPVADRSLEEAKGTIAGLDSIAKFGENPDIDIVDGFEAIWDFGGLYVPPTQARLHDMASTSANDAGTVVSSGTATGGTVTTLENTTANFVADGVVAGDYVLNDTNTDVGIVTNVTSATVLTMAGAIRRPNSGLDGTATASGDTYRVVTNASTGASIGYVQGLDASMEMVEEFGVLNGVANVPTALTYTRMFRGRVFGPGTTGLIGTLTYTAQTDATVTLQIIDGNNQTLMAVYTVASNKVGYLDRVWGALSKKGNVASEVLLRAGTLDGISYVVHKRSISGSGSSSFEYNFKPPLIIPGGADLWLEADTDTNNTGVAGGFDLRLEDD